MACKNIEEHEFKDKNIKPILELLISVFALHEIRKDNQLLYETGFFGSGSMRLLNDSYNEAL
jgi:hypothetical protein